MKKNLFKAQSSPHSLLNEVLLLDSGSIDKTCEIAKKLGARVENQVWLGFGPQKNRAVDLAANDWVFVLDSDERISSKLQSEIIATLNNPSCRWLLSC